jgi:putative tricarboxylic transport membrane protein
MARAYQVASVAFLLLGLFIMWQSFAINYMTRLGPGPGFFGVWLGGLLGLMSIIFLVQNSLPRWRRDEPFQLLPEAAARTRLLLVLATLTASVLLMPLLGFRLTILALCAVILGIVGRQPWWVTLLCGLIFSFGVFAVFNDFLQVILPVGLLGI